MRLILYGKPGCHLCEGLQEKLEQIQTLNFTLEVRDITTCEDWFQAYQYEIPVLYLVKDEGGGVQDEAENSSPRPHSSSFLIPRPSPRASVQQLEQMLQKYMQSDRTE